jgi:protein gp37
MGKETKIEWCDSTVNPTDFQCCGCELWNPKKGIKECYAGGFAERRSGRGAFDKPVVLKPGRMAEAAAWSDLRGTKRPDKPWLDGRPRVIFIGDMADILQPAVPYEYRRDEIVGTVTSELGGRHIWMLLTKQAARLAVFAATLEANGIPWPENLWPGVSVTSEATTDRINWLLKVKSDHRFISYEPAQGPVDFSRLNWLENIAMIIVGGQSGRGAKLHPFNCSWAMDVLEATNGFPVHVFVKQLGSYPFFHADGMNEPVDMELKHPKGGDWEEWPPGLRLRQFPAIVNRQS